MVWFKGCFVDRSDDEICERTKNAANIWANAWYVGVALNMTLGVTLLNNFDPGNGIMFCRCTLHKQERSRTQAEK